MVARKLLPCITVRFALKKVYRKVLKLTEGYCIVVQNVIVPAAEFFAENNTGVHNTERNNYKSRFIGEIFSASFSKFVGPF